MNMALAQIKSLVRRLLPQPVVKVDGELILRYVAKCLPPDATFVEVGTFTGGTGRWLRDLASLKAEQCHLIEACPTNFEILKQNSPGFRVYNLAVSDVNGTLPFYVVDRAMDEGSSRSNSFDREHLEKRFGKQNVKEQLVRSVNLDTFFSENNLTKVDFLFFNIEGAEYQVFRGNLDFLDRVRFFYLDLHHRDVPGLKRDQLAIYDLLEKKGFSRIAGHTREDIPRAQWHMTFLWEKKSPNT
jgi:2-O-methyltransferase